MARTNELPNIRLFHLFSLTGHSSIPTPRPICTPSDLCKASAMPSNLKYRPRVSGYWTKAPQSLSMEAKSVVVWSPITWWANTGVARAWKNTGNTELEASWSLNDCSIPLFGFHAWSLRARSHGHRINSWFLHSWFLQLLVPATAAIYLQQQHAGGKRRSKQMRRFTEKGINTIKLFFNVSKKATSIGSWKIKLLNVTAGARSIAAFRRERYGLSLKPM